MSYCHRHSGGEAVLASGENEKIVMKCRRKLREKWPMAKAAYDLHVISVFVYNGLSERWQRIINIARNRREAVAVCLFLTAVGRPACAQKHRKSLSSRATAIDQAGGAGALLRRRAEGDNARGLQLRLYKAHRRLTRSSRLACRGFLSSSATANNAVPLCNSVAFAFLPCARRGIREQEMRVRRRRGKHGGRHARMLGMAQAACRIGVDGKY